MENQKYITLDQDLKRLANQIRSVESLIDIELFKSYGKYAYYHPKHYVGSDKKRSRMIALKTLKNIDRKIKTISIKIKTTKDKSLIRQAVILVARSIELQMLFT